MSSPDQASKKDFKIQINKFLESFQKKAISDQNLWADYGKKLYYKFNQQDIKLALSSIRERHTKIEANALPLILETLKSLGLNEQKLTALPESGAEIEKKMLNALSYMLVNYAKQGWIKDILLEQCADHEYRRNNCDAFSNKVMDYVSKSSLTNTLKRPGDELGIKTQYSICIFERTMSAYTLAKKINELQKR